jgi:FK506-binding protein 1
MATEFTKDLIQAGNGVDRPKSGDTVGMQYTGWLYDPSKPENIGSK